MGLLVMGCTVRSRHQRVELFQASREQRCAFSADFVNRLDLHEHRINVRERKSAMFFRNLSRLRNRQHFLRLIGDM